MKDRSDPLVMHILGALVRHGAELRTLELIRHVVADPESNLRQAVMTLMPSDAGLLSEMEELGVPVFELNIRRPLFILEFCAVLWKNNPTIIHSHMNLLSGFLLTLARMGSKARGRIAHFRGEYVGETSRFRVKLLQLLTRFGANYILAVSPSTLARNWNPRDPKPAEVILSGLELSRFEMPADRSAILRSLALLEDTNLVVHIGRNDLVKNRAKAIEIFETYREIDANAVLCFVGDSGGRKDTPYWHLNEPSSRILYLGRRSDVPVVLKTASALLCTSLSEGLPGVVLEALVAGLPIVSTPLPGTEYLAREIAPIAMVNLSCPNTTWAEALTTVHTPAHLVDIRPTRVAELKGSKFDSAVAYQEFIRVWKGFL